MSAADLRHASLWQQAVKAGVNVEDIARAWASIDGHRDEFDAERDKSVFDEGVTGHYAGYIVEAEEMIKRATVYALNRRNAR